MTEPAVDPEDVQPVDHEELFEREVDVVDPLRRAVPVEADEADVFEQRMDLPELADEDEAGF